MRKWGKMEDYTGMSYIRERIPAENDVYRKMKPEWGKLFYQNGRLLYEGYIVDGMAYGSGTSYYPSGIPCQAGFFGPKGLICGREFYHNGQIRFEGTYQYNPGFGENWPVFGAYYDYEGNLKYYGAFDIIEESSRSVRPYVMQPDDYGPVMHLLVTRGYNYRFRGDQARKYYVEESPEFRGKIYKDEKEKQRTIYGKDKMLKRLRKGLSSNYPEIRSVSESELRNAGEWNEQDKTVLREKTKALESLGINMTPEERYNRDLRLLEIPRSVHQEYYEEFNGKPEPEKNRLLTRFSSDLESLYPYRWRADPRHHEVFGLQDKRGINRDNWYDHLDEMSDREISYMRDQDFGVGWRQAERMAYPSMSERAMAEWEKNW